MRFHNDDKERLLETAALRALSILSPEEVPSFPSFFSARGRRVHARREKTDAALGPGFLLRNEETVYTPALVRAGNFLIRELVRQFAGQAQKYEGTLGEWAAEIIGRQPPEMLQTFSAGVIKRLKAAGLTEDQARRAERALTQALRPS